MHVRHNVLNYLLLLYNNGTYNGTANDREFSQSKNKLVLKTQNEQPAEPELAHLI
jgi:hypothetical protein